MKFWELDAVRPAVHQALRAYHKISGTPQNLLEGLLLTQQQRRQTQAITPEALRHAANTVLLDGLTVLAAKDELGDTILRDRFVEQVGARRVAYEQNLSVDSINRLQGQAIDQLAEVIWAQEQHLRQTTAQALASRLPPARYSRLFGTIPLADTLIEALLAPDGPPIITLVGIGGIGKTALADYVLRHCIERFHFDDVIAVQVPPAAFGSPPTPPAAMFEQLAGDLYAALPDLPPEAPARDRLAYLHHRFKTQPHLVLIDNIEDEAHAGYLHGQLAAWGRPSRFLLTSRALPLVAPAAAVHTVTELDEAAALALLRHEAAEWGSDEMAAAPDALLHRLLQAVGGNPLALKLTVGLAQVMSLDAIITDLQRALSTRTQEMYQHIYRRAWQALSPAAQALLESMPLVSHTGATPEQMEAQSGLSADELLPAIQELAARSLLEIRGTLETRRYSIHQLTRTFLHTDIIGWDDSDAPT